MRAIRILPEVESDLDGAVAWLVREGERHAADRFLREFRSTIDRIANHGGIYRKSHAEFRHVKFSRFPYLVFYREEGDTLIIALVVNGARNPSVIRALLTLRR